LLFCLNRHYQAGSDWVTKFTSTAVVLSALQAAAAALKLHAWGLVACSFGNPCCQFTFGVTLYRPDLPVLYWLTLFKPLIPSAACRIDTILDCDHLLVLSNGQLVEQGPPNKLAAQTDSPGQGHQGVFAGMVAAAKAAAAGHHH
jgi:hypothetical protein